VQTPH